MQDCSAAWGLALLEQEPPCAVPQLPLPALRCLLPCAGRLGGSALSAFTLSHAITNISGIAFLNGITGGLDTHASQAHGCGAHAAIGLTLQRGLALSLLASVPLMLIYIPGIAPLLRLLRQEPALAAAAGEGRGLGREEGPGAACHLQACPTVPRSRVPPTMPDHARLPMHALRLLLPQRGTLDSTPQRFRCTPSPSADTVRCERWWMRLAGRVQMEALPASHLYLHHHSSRRPLLQLAAQGAAGHVLAAGAALFAVTAPLNWLFVFRLGWGLDGSALAAVACESVYVLAMSAACIGE